MKQSPTPIKPFSWHLRISFYIYAIITLPIVSFSTHLVAAFGAGDGISVNKWSVLTAWTISAAIFSPIIAWCWQRISQNFGDVRLTKRSKKLLLMAFATIILISVFPLIKKYSLRILNRNLIAYCDNHPAGSPFNINEFNELIRKEKLTEAEVIYSNNQLNTGSASTHRGIKPDSFGCTLHFKEGQVTWNSAKICEKYPSLGICRIPEKNITKIQVPVERTQWNGFLLDGQSGNHGNFFFLGNFQDQESCRDSARKLIKKRQLFPLASTPNTQPTIVTSYFCGFACEYPYDFFKKTIGDQMLGRLDEVECASSLREDSFAEELFLEELDRNPDQNFKPSGIWQVKAINCELDQWDSRYIKATNLNARNQKSVYEFKGSKVFQTTSLQLDLGATQCVYSSEINIKKNQIQSGYTIEDLQKTLKSKNPVCPETAARGIRHVKFYDRGSKILMVFSKEVGPPYCKLGSRAIYTLVRSVSE